MELNYSVPGEWINRRGEPVPRTSIRRIVVLKLDHIGDLLIAARAFTLLRRFFPDSHIDLICGPWNVALARRLELFDDVYGVNLFHEASGKQSNIEFASAARREGTAALVNMHLGPCDLAIDLRCDKDSRSILQIIDARIYAGFGTSHEFPFLDIVLPIHDGPGRATHPQSVLLRGERFCRGSRMPGEQLPALGGGLISCEITGLNIDFKVRGAKSPAECGTHSGDHRPLGIALESVSAKPLQRNQVAKGSWKPYRRNPKDADLHLLTGWAAPEDWGVWGMGEHCQLLLVLPPSQGEEHVQVDLQLRGHVNAGNKEVQCIVSAETQAVKEVSFVSPNNSASISLVVPRQQKSTKLYSEAFFLEPGDYRGFIRLYLPMVVSREAAVELRLRGLDTNVLPFVRHLGQRNLCTGHCDVPLAFRFEGVAERMTFEMDLPDASAFDGAKVELLSLECVRPQKLTVPLAHMERLLCQLVMNVALEFSDCPDLRGDRVAACLGHGGAGQCSEAVSSLHRQIRAWQEDARCVVGIGQGCNSEVRKWPAHYFVELARSLIAFGRVEIVFIGSKSDSAEAYEACRLLGINPTVHSYCGHFRLDELGAAIKPLDLFVGNNTGTTHLAGRMGIRTVGIYSGTNHPSEWGPVGPNSSWVTRNEQCSPCFISERRNCKFDLKCLRDLLPSDVLPILEPEIKAVLSTREAAMHDRAYGRQDRTELRSER